MRPWLPLLGLGMVGTVSANATPADPQSFAQPEAVAVKALALDLSVDFTRKVPDRETELRLDLKDKAAKELVPDTRDLHLDGVESRAGGGAPQKLALNPGKRDPVLGSALHIAVDASTPAVRIRYHTSPE